MERLIIRNRAADRARRTPFTDSPYGFASLTPSGRRAETPVVMRRRCADSEVSPEEARTLQAMSQVFANRMERHGGTHARRALASYLTHYTSGLLSAPATPELRRQVLVGAAQLIHLLARMTMDAGRPGLADRHFATALDLARQAEDRRIYAITLRAMSLKALRQGLHEKAWQLADTAIDIVGPSADPATLSFLLSQRALTHAHAQQRGRAIADLSAAEARHDRATSPPGAFSSYPRAGLDYQRGQTLLALGDSAQAAEALTSSIMGRPHDRHRSAALTHARLAATLLPLGRLEESCLHWHAFLDHYPSLRLVPADQALKHLRVSLHSFRDQSHATAVLHRARSVTRTRSAFGRPAGHQD
ncbi:hypothetical protein ABZ348_29145 [Streptomyces sp. NPDC005963]|uniref:hypothetical protein n=1 Tax=Streptomyces sp. NPDC005963 TaxID=3156721 RepID=UPI00340F48EA